MVVNGDISPYELRLLNQELTMRKTHEIPKNTEGSTESFAIPVEGNDKGIREYLPEMVLQAN